MRGARPDPALVDAVAAAIVARGGRREGRNEIRFRCPFPERHRNGDANPSARWNAGKAAWRCDVCGEGGGAFDLARRLGVPLPEGVRRGRAPRGGKSRCEDPEHVMRRETVYPIRDAAGVLVAEHVRRDFRDGCKDFTWRRNAKPGLDGIPVAELPLYGAEDVAAAPPGALVVLVEGERARGALKDRGILAAGTVTGASGTPSPASLAVLEGKDVVLWPDADEPGRAHMQRIAERLVALGIRPRWLEWGGEDGGAGRRRLQG